MPGYKTPKQDKKKPKMEMSRELTEAGDVADGTAQKMEQYKKMPQKRKMAQDKKMMQPRKSGIYMDRTDGALPQDRVAKYYQETNPKMEQLGTLSNAADQVIAGFKYGGKQFMKEAKDIYDSFKEGTKTGITAAGKGAKIVAKGAKDFVKGFDDRAQPTSSIKKRNSNLY